MWRFFLNTRLICALLATLFAQGLYVQGLHAQELYTEELYTEELYAEEPLDQTLPNAEVADELTDESAAEDAPSANTPAPAITARNSVVNLQTTVTGNQEQPRVLYILPWQSPETEAIGFELLDSEQSAVFGHVERDELRRQLEAQGEFD